MVSVRTAEVADLIKMQQANLHCLPENYHGRYYLYHFLSWPGIIKIAEDARGECVGYVLAKMDDEDDPAKVHGHITSLAVNRHYRKLGLASRLMRASMHSMVELYNAKYCSLHVRETNYAAIHLYNDTLGFQKQAKERGYYADGEDAWEMRKMLSREEVGLPPLEATEESKTEEKGGKKEEEKTTAGAGAAAAAGGGGSGGASAAGGAGESAAADARTEGK